MWARPSDALDALRRAIATDAAKVRGWLETDPMFDALKATADYDAVVHG